MCIDEVIDDLTFEHLNIDMLCDRKAFCFCGRRFHYFFEFSTETGFEPKLDSNRNRIQTLSSVYSASSLKREYNAGDFCPLIYVHVVLFEEEGTDQIFR